MNRLKNTYQQELPSSLYSLQSPEPVNEPEMVLFNDDLADKLEITSLFQNKYESLLYLSGNAVIPQSKPIAQAYAGHQFGYFNRLGDGRAVLLGEVETAHGLFDLQLKGSGQTAFSRRGDGRATLYSMLREYLISEAMFALGIPTTRSLSVVRTPDPVYRERVQEGGILCRVAASHIRVGTFEYARYFTRPADLESLLKYTINRHYPELLNQEYQALALLQKVMSKQIELIVNWMRVGFIHGVMNTDNMTISGETIDYGPCAFINVYDTSTVFSSIDTQGRYAFGNQPNIGFWNLKVFANSLLPLIDEDEETAKAKAESILKDFPAHFTKAYFEMLTRKLGILSPTEEDSQLAETCLQLLTKHRIDHTNFFTELRQGGEIIEKLRQADEFEVWYGRWLKARLRHSTLSESEALMKQVNPIIIPRNNLVEDALEAAINGNMEPFNTLLGELQDPYRQDIPLQVVPSDFDSCYKTFCGT